MFKFKWLIGCCLLVVLVASCKPRNVLSRKEMATVLYELHLTDAALQLLDSTTREQWAKGLTAEQFQDLSYQSVLRKHGLTQADFDASVAWYCKHLNLYDKIYKDVQGRLSLWRTEIARRSVEEAKGINGMSEPIRRLWRFGLISGYASNVGYIPTKDLIQKVLKIMYLGEADAEYNSGWSMFNDSDSSFVSDSLLIGDTLSTGNANSVGGTQNRQPIVHPRMEPEMTTGGHFVEFEPVRRPNPRRPIKETPKDEKIRERFKERINKPTEE